MILVNCGQHLLIQKLACRANLGGKPSEVCPLTKFLCIGTKLGKEGHVGAVPERQLQRRETDETLQTSAEVLTWMARCLAACLLTTGRILDS